METENFKKHEGMGRLKELAEDIQICMMLTGLDEKEPNAVPMTTKKVDKNGTLWFLSLDDSLHNQQIRSNARVKLLYSDPVKMEFLNISGKAEIDRSPALLKEFYDEATDNWSGGMDDPRLTVIKFVPEKAYFWDTRTNKYEALYHLGIAALTK